MSLGTAHNCVRDEELPNRYYYTCDTQGGVSGSGLYMYFPGQNPPENRILIGVHAYGDDPDCNDDMNHAVRIRPDILLAMCGTFNEDEKKLCF